MEIDSDSVGSDAVVEESRLYYVLLYLHTFPKMKLCKNIVWLMLHVFESCGVLFLSNRSLKSNANFVEHWMMASLLLLDFSPPPQIRCCSFFFTSWFFSLSSFSQLIDWLLSYQYTHIKSKFPLWLLAAIALLYNGGRNLRQCNNTMGSNNANEWRKRKNNFEVLWNPQDRRPGKRRRGREQKNANSPR